jgi:hypothetical protein
MSNTLQENADVQNQIAPQIKSESSGATTLLP